MDKIQREERRRQEDMALNRALAWVGAAIVLELLLLLVNRFYINVYTTEASVSIALALGTVLKALRVVGLIGAVACAVWVYMNLKKGAKTTLPLLVLMGCAAVGFCSHIAVTYSDSGVRMLFVLVPAWAALAVAFHLYQREFFYSALFSGFGAVALWLIRHKGTNAVTTYGFLIVFAVVMVACAVLLNQARQNDGVLTVVGLKLRMLPKSANYLPILITAVVNIAAVVLALIMGGTVAYYLIYALVAWLFALLVFYTVKMM